jgi:hypothetical protein
VLPPLGLMRDAHWYLRAWKENSVRITERGRPKRSGRARWEPETGGTEMHRVEQERREALTSQSERGARLNARSI